MTTSVQVPTHVDVSTPQGASGTLQHAVDYLFGYEVGASAHAEISLTMPRRAPQYVSAELHPIFQMNLPEGYVLDELRRRFAKASSLAPMLLLALTAAIRRSVASAYPRPRLRRSNA